MAVGYASSGARGSNSCTKVAIATIVTLGAHEEQRKQQGARNTLRLNVGPQNEIHPNDVF